MPTGQESGEHLCEEGGGGKEGKGGRDDRGTPPFVIDARDYMFLLREKQEAKRPYFCTTSSPQIVYSITCRSTYSCMWPSTPPHSSCSLRSHSSLSMTSFRTVLIYLTARPVRRPDGGDRGHKIRNGPIRYVVLCYTKRCPCRCPLPNVPVTSRSLRVVTSVSTGSV